jgi:poly-gamma-glutamate capsule biosynthesis protein CapA/YwtB (metallophosphatase superfamily)
MNKLLKIILTIIVILFLLITIAMIIRSRFPSLLGSRTSITKFSDTTDGRLQSYYRQAQNLSPRGDIATTSATFLAVGDIMLSRNVALTISKANDSNLPFEGMADILKSVDFNFANLESPFAPMTKYEIIGGHSLIFAAPLAYATVLANYNFKILNLANNHAFDLGLPGIKSTRENLDIARILHEGTGENLDQAWTPAVITSNGIKICFIGASFSSINDGGKTTNNYVARIEDLNNLKSAIRNSQLSCNFIVVTMHAGTEYTRKPNDAQIKFAHAAIDDGADIVIGAHPHWVQTIERYCPLQYSPPLEGGARGGNLKSNLVCPNPKYIFYSLGNFIFDQNFSQDTMEGLTLKIALSKTGATADSPSFSKEGAGGSSLSADDIQGSRIPAALQSIELIPVIIQNSQPRAATGDESKKILKKINLNLNILTP